MNKHIFFGTHAIAQCCHIPGTPPDYRGVLYGDRDMVLNFMNQNIWPSEGMVLCVWHVTLKPNK